ncbi:HDL559Wp [Eremothecium sinecaudum]|uniref:Protein transport protein BOS1 n=1 Tax=Eremothecium sinecaudum TaxID=45286 RepID=A0A0X8HRN0_9SACH|nr:HDL559Wp [Eremothecium sinecaudum]AMD20185.1 HDL559Wp [Eremothecium sinecaudum]
MNALYNHAVKQKSLLQRDLARFEKEREVAPISLQGSISTTLVALEKTIGQYREQLSAYQSDIRSDSDENYIKYKTRLSTIDNDLTEFKQRFKLIKEQCNEGSSRERMFGGGSAFIYEEGSSSVNKRATTGVQQRSLLGENGERTTFNSAGGLPLYEGLRREQSIFERGNAKLDSILQMGQESLEEIIEQNRILQKVQQKMLKSLRTLGVSNETIDFINKRVFRNKVVFWTALVLMFVGCYFVMKWFR